MRPRASVLVGVATLAVAALVQAATPASGSQAAGEPTFAGEPFGSPAVRTVADTVAVSAAAAGRRARRPRHELVRVVGPIALSDRPGGPAKHRLEATTEFGTPRVLGVAARRGGWLGVVTSARPNGRLAWVRGGQRSLRPDRTRWSLHADLSRRSLVLRAGGRPVARAAVAIGRPESPTPTGRFAVTDKLDGSRFSPYYGCCVLALSGSQPNPPPGWTGGNRLAIHGTNTPGTIGAAASAGCLRAADADLRVLMRKAPLGTPVFIRR